MALSANSPERGSMILFLFIAIALFGALSYAFMHGSRSSVSMLEGERDEATATATQDCTNTVNLAVKRLELRGCGSKISYLADGSNTNADAPTDGSCSVFHPNGGGAKACNASALTPCDMTSLLPGETGCGVVYAGTALIGGYRIYTTPADQAPASWNNGILFNVVTNANSATDGMSNTNILVGINDGASPYNAANSCRALGSEWFLPSQIEAFALNSSRNLGDLAGTFTIGDFYWTSSEWDAGNAAWYKPGTGNGGFGKATVARVRCIRRD